MTYIYVACLRNCCVETHKRYKYFVALQRHRNENLRTKYVVFNAVDCTICQLAFFSQTPTRLTAAFRLGELASRLLLAADNVQTKITVIFQVHFRFRTTALSSLRSQLITSSQKEWYYRDIRVTHILGNRRGPRRGNLHSREGNRVGFRLEEQALSRQQQTPMVSRTRGAHILEDFVKARNAIE